MKKEKKGNRIIRRAKKGKKIEGKCMCMEENNKRGGCGWVVVSMLAP